MCSFFQSVVFTARMCRLADQTMNELTFLRSVIKSENDCCDFGD